MLVVAAVGLLVVVALFWTGAGVAVGLPWRDDMEDLERRAGACVSDLAVLMLLHRVHL